MCREQGSLSPHPLRVLLALSPGMAQVADGKEVRAGGSLHGDMAANTHPGAHGSGPQACAAPREPHFLASCCLSCEAHLVQGRPENTSHLEGRQTVHGARGQGHAIRIPGHWSS